MALTAETSGWMAAANVISHAGELRELRAALDRARAPHAGYQISPADNKPGCLGFTLLHHVVCSSYWHAWKGTTPRAAEYLAELLRRGAEPRARDAQRKAAADYDVDGRFAAL